MRIEDLGLSEGTVNVLRRGGIHTTEELILSGARGLSRMPNLGVHRLCDLVVMLAYALAARNGSAAFLPPPGEQPACESG